ncbi:COG1470 family protein [Infirmifilum sp. NZ]|uniref:COG1470 family protein n=1 Tax=Infirmifilum sp. NZ TaxID=2926850 RepID=UPI00279E00F7|nr:archaellin/type IV pilin N-terminal domain-containing protein [Infirmifilum sp. NZ]UNQ73637.1 hypothetical protein MOV14_01145 [Infirmifilum sp. NZ]
MERGVSPVLASLLLVLVAVAAGVLAYLFISGFRPSVSGARPLLKVEGVGFEGGLVLYVRNIGETREVLDAVYVYDSSGRLVWHAGGLNLTAQPGQLVLVRLDLASLKPGERYTVTVAGASGVVSPGFSFMYTGAGGIAYATLLVYVYPPGSGSTDPAPGRYVYPAGSRVRVSASPAAGYAFSGWLLNGSALSTSPVVEVVVAGVVNLTAVFQPLQPPRFSILSYNSSISGAVGSRQFLVVKVNNTGQQAGVAVVEVYDHNSNLVNATQLSVPPAAPQTASLAVTLPAARGTYTWTLKVKNPATGSYDDSKAIAVTALQPARFAIASSTGSVSGPPGSKALVSVTVANTGDLQGDARVEVRDSSGGLVNSTALTIPPGSQAQAQLQVTLPTTPSTYTWTIAVLNLATNSYDDSRSMIVTVTQPLLAGPRRAAVYYDTFDADPINSNLTPLSCSWQHDSTDKLLYVTASSNPSSYDGECLLTYTSQQLTGKVYVAALVSFTGGSGRAGVVYGESDYKKFYEWSLDSSGYYSIYRFVGNWHPISSEHGSFQSGVWYDLVGFYDSDSDAIELWSNGSRKVSDGDKSVHPVYPGLGAYWVSGALTVRFDNLVVSVDARPWFVNVTGLPDGWTARVRVGSTVVSSAKAAGGVASIPLWLSEVPSKDYAFIVRNAILEVLDPSGTTAATLGPADIVGGDVYTYG